MTQDTNSDSKTRARIQDGKQHNYLHKTAKEQDTKTVKTRALAQDRKQYKRRHEIIMTQTDKDMKYMSTDTRHKNNIIVNTGQQWNRTQRQ